MVGLDTFINLIRFRIFVPQALSRKRCRDGPLSPQNVLHRPTLVLRHASNSPILGRRVTGIDPSRLRSPSTDPGILRPRMISQEAWIGWFSCLLNAAESFLHSVVHLGLLDCRGIDLMSLCVDYYNVGPILHFRRQGILILHALASVFSDKFHSPFQSPFENRFLRPLSA